MCVYNNFHFPWSCVAPFTAYYTQVFTEYVMCHRRQQLLKARFMQCSMKAAVFQKDWDVCVESEHKCLLSKFMEKWERENREKKTFAHEEVDIFNIEMHKAFSAFHTGSIRTCNIRIETAYFCWFNKIAVCVCVFVSCVHISDATIWYCLYERAPCTRH